MLYGTVEEFVAAMTRLQDQGHPLKESSNPLKRTLGFTDTADNSLHEVELTTVLRGGLSYRWLAGIDTRRKRIEG